MNTDNYLPAARSAFEPSKSLNHFKRSGLMAALAVFLGAGGVQSLSAQSTVTTVPVGVMSLTVAAGTGVSRVNTAISVPLLMEPQIVGVVRGVVTSFTGSSVTSTGAGWQAGELSVPQLPYLIRFTSGAAIGRTFLISRSTPNTADTASIDYTETASFSSSGLAVGDTFQIIPADTLGNLFPLSSGVLAGSTTGTADTVMINRDGSWRTYYYSTSVSPNRWTRYAIGYPDASNEVIKPDDAIVYGRLGATALYIKTSGVVPNISRAASVANGGLTFISSGWPTSVTLAQANFDKIPGWKANSSYSLADRVTLLVNGSWRTYFFDGTNWRAYRIGYPISNTEIINPGTGILLDRRSTDFSKTVYKLSLPYSL